MPNFAYTGWPKKNGTAYFRMTGISGWAIRKMITAILVKWFLF